MAFYTGTGISEQASPVFWQVGAPRGHFGKFWTRDGHSMIRGDEISEQGSVSTSEAGDFAFGILQRAINAGQKRTFSKIFLFALFNETFLCFSCIIQNKVVPLQCNQKRIRFCFKHQISKLKFSKFNLKNKGAKIYDKEKR